MQFTAPKQTTSWPYNEPDQRSLQLPNKPPADPITIQNNAIYSSQT